jgi:hypothetical protein
MWICYAIFGTIRSLLPCVLVDLVVCLMDNILLRWYHWDVDTDLTDYRGMKLRRKGRAEYTYANWRLQYYGKQSGKGNFRASMRFPPSF